MKRIFTAALASLVLAGSVTAAASADPFRGPPRQYDQRYDTRHDDRHDGRFNDRDNGRYDRYDRYDRAPHWKRGDRLGQWNRRYAEVDYRSHRLRAPPRGYHYVRDDRGDIILAAVATGIIAAIIAAQ